MLAGGVSLPGNSHADAVIKPQAAGTGTLTGAVTLGPISPVQRQDIVPIPRPAAGVKLLILTPARQEVAAVTTDAAGQFRCDLPPGAYEVEMAPRKGKEFTKDLPATVTITPGQETRLDIRLDTGMR
ncbi:MAG: carboxypeptidase-like regulatory domain-containing protein [Desulfobaccales bacterium]